MATPGRPIDQRTREWLIKHSHLSVRAAAREARVSVNTVQKIRKNLLDK